MMKYMLLAAVFFQAAYSKCPNACNGHGTCNIHDQCTCFNEDGKGVEYLATDSVVGNPGSTCHAHKTKEKCVDISKEYQCKWDPKEVLNTIDPKTGEKTVGECKRVVKDVIVPDSVKQYQEWQGADCSRRTCPRDTSWTQMGSTVTDKVTHICTHKTQQECSDQGVCDRATGLCECFPGFTGSACQRTACPDDCSGHGTCRSNKDFAYDWGVAKTHQLMQTDQSTELFKEVYIATYDGAWDSEHLYGCYCDSGYRGANCALIECPSSNDPLDDRCSKEEDEFTVENFQVQKFASTGSDGWKEAFVDSTSPLQTKNFCADHKSDKGKCEAQKGPNAKTDTCKFIKAKEKTKTQEAQPSRCEQVGPWERAAPGDKNNHFYNGKVYACFGAMSGMDCSGRGICDYTTGQCSCFSGYSGTSCAKIEELS